MRHSVYIKPLFATNFPLVRFVVYSFIEHLCTYALRRVLTVDDRDDLKLIEEEANKNQYRVKDIVRAVALSELMRKR